MVSVNQIEQGLGRYLDTELMPKLPDKTLYKIGIGAAVSIAVKRLGRVVECLKSNPIIKALDIIDDSGNVDIDVVIDELKKQIPEEGYCYHNAKFGDFRLVIRAEDVEEMRRCIVEVPTFY